VPRSKCEAALERAWSDRGSFRYNKGTEGRGTSYFSPRHLADIARKLSYYPQLHSWMPDLIGGGTELREVGVRAAS
jgi:hypothetical protein